MNLFSYKELQQEGRIYYLIDFWIELGGNMIPDRERKEKDLFPEDFFLSQKNKFFFKSNFGQKSFFFLLKSAMLAKHSSAVTRRLISRDVCTGHLPFLIKVMLCFCKYYWHSLYGVFLWFNLPMVLVLLYANLFFCSLSVRYNEGKLYKTRALKQSSVWFPENC